MRAGPGTGSAAAAAAGFRGFGLLHADLVPALAEYGSSGLRTLLDDNGIADLEPELCGEGSFDLAAIIAALRTTGLHGPWGVEILSAEHRKTPLRPAVAAAYDTAEALLDRLSG
jgi:sugar phosphate isomerase/epimerase